MTGSRGTCSFVYLRGVCCPRTQSEGNKHHEGKHHLCLGHTEFLSAVGRRTAGDICRKFAGCDSQPTDNTAKFTQMYINFKGGRPAVGRLSTSCQRVHSRLCAGPPPAHLQHWKNCTLVVGWLPTTGLMAYKLFILCWLANNNNYIKSSPLLQKCLFLIDFNKIGIIVKMTFFFL